MTSRLPYSRNGSSFYTRLSRAFCADVATAPLARPVTNIHNAPPNLAAKPKFGHQSPQGKPTPRFALGNEGGKVYSTGAAAQKLPTAQGRPGPLRPAASPQQLSPNSSMPPDLAKELAERYRLLKEKEKLPNAQQKKQRPPADFVSKQQFAAEGVKKKSVTAAAGPVIQKGNEENQALLANRKTPPQKQQSSVIDLTCPDSSSEELRYTHVKNFTPGIHRYTLWLLCCCLLRDNARSDTNIAEGISIWTQADGSPGCISATNEKEQRLRP